MDSRRWHEVERLYHAAAGQEVDARIAYLEQACGDDEELRVEVASLLAGDVESAKFLEVQAFQHFQSHIGRLLVPMSPGDRLASYEIVALIGEGGMGEVYRARDSRLNRDVALKVLPTAFSHDEQYMTRFAREAQLLASLNHPNIATVYGLEQGAIVMELVEGEDLHGPLPPEDALAIARQIAAALEAAHEKGIIHRDLKPPNIKVTPQGVVKLLDFGLARSTWESPFGSDPAVSPPPLADVTREGMIIGTARYMSPEQARGKPVDKRTDIWAFGAVLFELLTGEVLFGGETASDAIAGVLGREPDWQLLPRHTPPHVRTLLARCLRKDPKLRLRDIGEARILLDQSTLEEPSGTNLALVHATPRSRRISLPWIVAGICAVLTVFLVVLLWRAASPAPQTMLRFNVDLGPEAVAGKQTTVAISPDGTRLVYPVRRGTTQLLATRLMDQTGLTILAGTEDGADPFFSPDGQWIGFSAGGYLKKISAQGGAPATLCAAEVTRGASWGEDGAITFSSADSGLSQVSATGGKPRILTKPQARGESTHRYPQVLPGGNAVLFTGLDSPGGFDDASIEVLFPRTGEIRVVQRGGYYGRFLPGGHLIFVHKGTLYAVAFDLAHYQTLGIPVPVAEDIAANSNGGGGQLNFSQTGTLVYLNGKSGGAQGPLLSLDAQGRNQVLLSAPDLASPRFSPDGKRLAFSSGGVSVYDLSTGVVTRLDKDRKANNFFPIWTPDGAYIIYSSATGIWRIRSDGSGDAQLLYRPPGGSGIPWSFSPDGRWLAFQQPGDGGGRDLWTLPVNPADPSHPGSGSPELFLATGGSNLEPTFSPDGRWLAYSATQEGLSKVFVRPFPEGAQGHGQVQISPGPGRFPVWSRTAKQLFYMGEDSHIMVVPYTVTGRTFAAAKAQVWADISLPSTGYASPYDLAPDGKHFAVFPAAGNSGRTSVHVTFLVNFFDALNRQIRPQGQ